MSAEQNGRLEGVGGEGLEMEHRIHRDNDDANLGDGRGGIGYGAAANDALEVDSTSGTNHGNDEEGSALNIEQEVDGSEPPAVEERPVALVGEEGLPPDMLFYIFQSMEDCDKGNFAETSKGCQLAMEDAAENTLRQISENAHVGSVFMWRLGLNKQASARIERYYEQQGMPPTPDIKLTYTPRLLLRCAQEVPLSSHETQSLGPVTVLPDGNLAFYCVEDRFFRFYNVRSGAFYHEAPAVGSSFPHIPFESWIGKDLHCSNGFLVLQRHEIGQGSTVNFSVWHQSDLTFVRDIRLGRPKGCVFDKERGTILFTASRDGTTILDIMSIDIESGEQSHVKSIRTQLAGTVMRDCVVSMGFSGRKIVIAVFIEDNGQFPDAGLGVYTLRRDRPHEGPTSYFACFEQGLYLNIPEVAPCQLSLIPFQYNNDRQRTLRAIRLSGDDPVVVDELVPLEGRPNVVRVTDTRLFVHNPDATGDIQVDELDIGTGRKMRTIRTGYSNQDDMLIRKTASSNSMDILQTFLL